VLDRITPLILTLDEAPNVERVLARLSWARDIVVVDSGSRDGTCEILARYPNVRVFRHPFRTHAEQWNFGLEGTAIRSEWVLALDGDYVLSDAFVEEIAVLDPPAHAAGYRASFTYCIEGRPLRGAAYSPVVVLYRRDKARYVQDGHTQRVQVDGAVHPLRGRIFHDDRKPLGRWLSAQAGYMELEAGKLASRPFGELGLADRLRRLIVIAPLAIFVYCFFLRGGLLDGRAGLFYALQRTTAEMILSLYVLRGVLARGGLGTANR
jgi:glycosyltransferase involved in cell wall biosynthesis